MKTDLYRPKYTEPPKLDEAGLVAYLITQPGVAAAYLFGSLAMGKATVNSDVDIAILLVDVPDDAIGSLERETQLSEGIRPFVDREFDLVILNRATLTRCQKVLATGRLLYEGERPIRIEFQMLVMREYAEVTEANQRFARLLWELTGEQPSSDLPSSE